MVTLPALAQSLPEPANLVEPSLMPHGIFVAGLALNRTTNNGSELAGIGNLRFGLFNRIEIQANSVQGIENYSSRQLTLGSKVRLWQEQGHVPKVVIGLSSQSRLNLFLPAQKTGCSSFRVRLTEQITKPAVKLESVNPG